MHEDTFFELVDGHSIGMLNVPATYPPKPLSNGFMVSGMMTPSIDKSCLDEDIVQTLKDMDYRIEVHNTFQGDNEDELLPEMESVIDKRADAAKKLLDEEDPDVFMATFVTADRASHWFWKHMDENHPDHTAEDEEYKDVVREFYAKTDEKLGELLDQVDEETDVVVMSDHGFTGLEKSINLNNLFMRKGYLTVKKNPLSLLRYALFQAGFTLENVYSLVQKLGLGSMVKQVADSPETNTLRQILSLPFLSFQDIDWEQTTAYTALHFGPIFLNCSGEERERLKQQIKEDLEALEDGGEHIIDEI